MAAKIHFKRIGRELAMQFLFQYNLNQEEFDSVDLIRFFKQMDQSNAFKDSRELRRGKKYTAKLVEGIIENINIIDEKINEFISEEWDWARIAPVDKGILRVATYEMLFEEGVPPIVAINEAVELAKKFGSDQSKRFVNGLLNNLKNTLDRDPRGEKK
jgi:N utilization substance protein B